MQVGNESSLKTIADKSKYTAGLIVKMDLRQTRDRQYQVKIQVQDA